MSKKKADAGGGGKGEDRHASGFMIRLPERYRDSLRQFQEQYYREHRIRPTMTQLVSLALDRWLESQGLDVPEEGGAE